MRSKVIISVWGRTYHLFLMPITAYTSPVISSRAPVRPIAGVTLGWIGSGFSGSLSTILVSATLALELYNGILTGRRSG